MCVVICLRIFRANHPFKLEMIDRSVGRVKQSNHMWIMKTFFWSFKIGVVMIKKTRGQNWRFSPYLSGHIGHPINVSYWTHDGQCMLTSDSNMVMKMISNLSQMKYMTKKVLHVSNNLPLLKTTIMDASKLHMAILWTKQGINELKLILKPLKIMTSW